MNLKLIVYPLTRAYYAWVKHRERQIGYRLVLNAPAAHWIPATMIFDMAPVWRRFGLEAKGVNYFTIGKVENGISTRYDQLSPYYQAWLGGYIVQFPKNRSWTMDDHWKLGVADQKNWLQMYGIRHPFVEVQKESVKNRGHITISGYEGTLNEGNIWSNTDVGDAKPRTLPLMMAGMAQMYKLDNPKTELVASDFIPQWWSTSPLAPYQKILLKGNTAIIPLNENTTAILYINWCAYTDKNKNQIDNFDGINERLREFKKNIVIEKLR